jgi:GT2 family glycosyltransferase
MCIEAFPPIIPYFVNHLIPPFFSPSTFPSRRPANVGRGLPVSPELNVARKVDYISAACVIFEKAKFIEVGGFDFRYKHGYYEDTDLAFKMVTAGYDIILQPLSVVYHVSGTTLGKDKKFKQNLLSTNKSKFVSKWKETLHKYHYPKEVGQVVARQRLIKKQLLWVEKEFTGTWKDWDTLEQLQELAMHSLSGKGCGTNTGIVS